MVKFKTMEQKRAIFAKLDDLEWKVAVGYIEDLENEIRIYRAMVKDFKEMVARLES